MALIGVSGKAGSGKDTIGKIIQYLITEHKIENSNIHPATFEQFCDEKYNELFGYCDWKVVKFASKLKQIVSILTGIPVEDLEKQEVKNRVLGEEWRRFFFRGKIDGIRIPKSFYGIHVNEIEAYKTIENMNHLDIATEVLTVRQLLQEIGTEAMRDIIHPNVWVNALFADYKEHKPPKGDTFDYFHAECIDCKKSFSGYKRQFICNDCYDEHNWYPNWIITDLRFPNELDAIKQRGGITIRVNRFTGHVVIDNDTHVVTDWQHPSETALDNAMFDYTIINDGSIEDLIEKVKEILIKEKII
jgi:hypothetical protein